MSSTPHAKLSHVPLGISGRRIQISCGGLREGPSRKSVCQKAQLKCLYTNACSVGNKQELETVMGLENYDLITITEMWDKSHDWHTVIEGYRLLRDRVGGEGELPSVLGSGMIVKSCV